MSKRKETEGKDAKWGTYWFIGIIVAIICVGVILYIGWFDNNTHVDSPDGDNVLQTYEQVTPQPDAPGVNDWNNPDDSGIQQIIVEHATGTDTVPMAE